LSGFTELLLTIVRLFAVIRTCNENHKIGLITKSGILTIRCLASLGCSPRYYRILSQKTNRAIRPLKGSQRGDAFCDFGYALETSSPKLSSLVEVILGRHLWPNTFEVMSWALSRYTRRSLICHTNLYIRSISIYVFKLKGLEISRGTNMRSFVMCGLILLALALNSGATAPV